jgi:hypothetical protein
MGLLKPPKRCSHSRADVKTVAVATQMALAIPSEIPFQSIDRVKALLLDQALGKTEGHRRVVGPFSRLQVKGTAANHICQRWERARELEFERRP